jgi:outer membrane protein
MWQSFFSYLTECLTRAAFLFLGVGLAFVEPKAALASAPVSFHYFYSHALKSHELVELQKSRVTQAEAQYSQARGALFPSLSLLGSYSRQDSSQASTGGLAAFRLADQWNSRLNLTQPIFRGLAEYGELAARSWDVDSQRSNLFEAERQLFSTVAQAYYEVLAAREDLANVRALRKLTEERVVELQQRAKIGRSRSGEVLAAQAQLVALDSQAEANELALTQAQNRLVIQSGIASPFELESLEASEARVPKNPLPLDKYIDRLSARPDLVALEAAQRASERRISVARAGHFPSVDLSANYYLKRNGPLEGVKWDFGVVAVLPIFQGGTVVAAVDTAVESQKQAALQLAQVRRTALVELKNAYEMLQSFEKQISAWQKSVQISERNYREQKRDYSLGLATNVEVLQALNAYQELERNLDRTRAQRLSAWASLAAIAGELPK